MKQHSQAPFINACVVADNHQALSARFTQSEDEIFRNAAEAKAAYGQSYAVLNQSCKRNCWAGIDLIHRSCVPFCSDEKLIIRASSTRSQAFRSWHGARLVVEC